MKPDYKCGLNYWHTRPIINKTTCIFKLSESFSNICTFMILG